MKYTGAQAPPLQSRLPLVREYGEQSLAFNKNLVEQKKIWIEWDSQIRDEQNNLLGYVFLEDGTFVNQKIVEAGYARAILKAPNLKYSAKLRRAQIEAKRQKLGLWEKEVNNPYITEYPYIGEKNTKVYYFPDSPELERIPEAQLIKFRSRVEAKAAGYRACATCKEDQDPFKVSDAY